MNNSKYIIAVRPGTRNRYGVVRYHYTLSLCGQVVKRCSAWGWDGAWYAAIKCCDRLVAKESRVYTSDHDWAWGSETISKCRRCGVVVDRKKGETRDVPCDPAK